MNVLSLFDGCSGGQQALERLGLPVENYFASEIDKYAIQVTMANYPNTIQLGSVIDVDVRLLPKIDLLCGGSPCFVKGTKVLTSQGYKNIEDIVVGDSVFTHTSKYQKVLAVGGNKSQFVYKIKAQGMLDTFATKEHPYFVKTMSRKWDNARRSSYRHFSEAYWKEAGSLSKGDFVGIKINEMCENPLNITKEEAYLIGRYIADGHTRKDMRTSENRPTHRHWQMILSIGDSKVDGFKNKFESFGFSCYKHTKSVYRCVFSSKRLVEIVEEHCGSGAMNKKISPMLQNLPVDLLSELIEGYVSGDGFVQGDKVKCSTISQELAMSLCLAVAKVYNTHANVLYRMVPPTCVIEGRTVNQNNCYVMDFSKSVKKQNKSYVSEGYIWLPIKEVTLCDQKQDVFNIEVDEDNTYTANNIVVHNCQSFSFAGKRKGMSTKDSQEILTLKDYLKLKSEGFEFEGQSYLFWEYMRVLEDIRAYNNPDVNFMLENVEMGEKWEKVLSKAIGVNGNHINSALVSAQNRKRIYWCNFGVETVDLFNGVSYHIPQPKDRGILLKDILQDNPNPKYYIPPKMEEHLNSRETVKIKDGDDKSGTITPNGEGKQGNNSTFICQEVDDKYYLSEKMIAGFERHRERHIEKGTGFVFNPTEGDKKSAALRANAALCPTDNSIIVHNTMPRSSKTGKGGTGPLSREDGKTYCLDTGNTNAIEIYNNKRLNETLNKNELVENCIIDSYNQNVVTEKSISVTTRINASSCTHVYKQSRIRRLTPLECMRLQTIRDDFNMPVSDSQKYKIIGNGWTIEVVAHIFSFLTNIK